MAFTLFKSDSQILLIGYVTKKLVINHDFMLNYENVSLCNILLENPKCNALNGKSNMAAPEQMDQTLQNNYLGLICKTSDEGKITLQNYAPF